MKSEHGARTSPAPRTAAAWALVVLAPLGVALADDPPAARPATGTGSGSTTLAIVGGDVLTVTRGTVRRGTVLVRDGKIVAVGHDVQVPAGATVIDAAGRYVTPGFVAVEMSRVGLGMTGASSGTKVADALDPFDQSMKFALGAGITTGATQVGGGSSSGFRFNAPDGAEVDLGIDDLLALHGAGLLDDATLLHLVEHAEAVGHAHLPGEEPGLVSLGDPRFFSAADRFNSCGHCSSTLIHATPSTRLGRDRDRAGYPHPWPEEPPAPPEPLAPPSPDRPRPASYAVLKLTYGDLDGMLVDEQPFYSLPASSLDRPFDLWSWRENVRKARRYVEDLARHEAAVKAGNKDSKAPEKSVDDALIRLVKREIPLRTTASSTDEIRDMIALARELDYRLVLDRAHEGWLVADELASGGVAVVLTPRDKRDADRTRPDSSGTSIEAPGIFRAAGVEFAVAPLSPSISLDGLPGRDLTSLPLEAAFAVRGGADEATALAAITIVPARILGLDDRIGSIETGKDADLLILDGPPLDYRTYVEVAVVAGKVRYERSKDRIYPVFDRRAR